MTKREVEVLVLSDIHLGTQGCHAKELLQYLKTIQPKMVVLNGDIIDIWQFKKRYWPPLHTAILLHFIAWASEQIPVYYITGNHDEYLRKFADTELGSLKIKNKLSLKLNNKQVWIFHGDVFDVVMQHSKWLAKLGSIGYDALILLNRLVNTFLLKMGRERVSISKKIKNSVKKAVAFMNKFEDTVCSIAAEHNYDYAICGHIHQPEKKIIVTPHGVVHYLNSGDWIENLSALEYNEDQWKLYFYEQAAVAQQVDLASLQSKTMDIPELFNLLISQTQKV